MQKNLIKILFNTFCTIGCVYHILTVFDMYLSYEVERNFSIKIDDEVEIPQLSVCMDIASFYQFKSIVTIENDLTDPKRMQIYKALDGKYTLRNVYQRLPKFSNIIKSVFVAAKAVNQTWKAPPLRIKPFFFEPFYCFAIGVSTEEPYLINRSETQLIEHNFFKINLNRIALKGQTGVYLFVHRHSTLIQERSLGIKKFQLPDSGTSCEFTFEKIHYSYLPYPFETDCIDYRKIGYSWKYEAIDSCIQNLVLKEFNRNFPHTGINVENDRLFGYYFFYIKRYNATHLSKVRDIRRHCRKLFNKPECEGIFYRIVHYFQSENNDETVQISMKVLSSPDIYITAKPRLTFPQTILYLANVLGLWFGFSVNFGFQITLKFIVNIITNLGKIQKNARKLNKYIMVYERRKQKCCNNFLLNKMYLNY